MAEELHPTEQHGRNPINWFGLCHYKRLLSAIQLLGYFQKYIPNTIWQMRRYVSDLKRDLANLTVLRELMPFLPWRHCHPKCSWPRVIMYMWLLVWYLTHRFRPGQIAQYLIDKFKWICMNENDRILFKYHWKLFIWVPLAISQQWFC